MSRERAVSAPVVPGAVTDARGGELAFTGAPLVPVFSVGLALFMGGLLLRRRASGAATAIMPAGEAAPLSTAPKTTPEPLLKAIDPTVDSEESYERQAGEEAFARELQDAEARLTQARERTSEALERAAELLDRVVQRARAAEQRVARAERLAEIRAAEEERSGRLQEILDRITAAERQITDAERRARAAVERASSLAQDLPPAEPTAPPPPDEPVAAKPDPDAPEPPVSERRPASVPGPALVERGMLLRRWRRSTRTARSIA